MPIDRRALGTSGEDAAAAWYVAKGYEVVARNWRSGRTGELDVTNFDFRLVGSGLPGHRNVAAVRAED